jgi:uncharacterized protein (UPF0261 family)/ABC-type branched-subunit amino acid transport system ATPase component
VRAPSAVLSVKDLQVYYGSSHALQGVNLNLVSGVHAVVGRNGMGKTTLCNAIMGLVPVRSGSIRIDGQEATGKKPHEIAAMGVGYTPQGRRLWTSLTVDEHLRMTEIRGSAWTVDRVYDTFPRLAERRSNGGGQLSGGEQQMLAIGRALLRDPHLLVLDEPTEGLAPVIVAQVEELLHKLAEAGDVAILLVEQNIGVATSVADDVAIMVNGQITTVMDASALGNDRALQQRLLGVGRVDETDTRAAPLPAPPPSAKDAVEETEDAAHSTTPQETKKSLSGYVPPTRWSRARWEDAPGDALPQPATVPAMPAASDIAPFFAENLSGQVLVAGTFDTKAQELGFIADRLRARGISVRTVDLSTSGKPSSQSVPPHMVATWHPRGASSVFSGDRGQSVAAMAEAFERWINAHSHVQGIISAAGSGGTALVTPAMRRLPVGVPKVMISTVASGNVAPYVGPSDIMMMYSVTDVQGLNRISRSVLGNGADALAGMIEAEADTQSADQPAIGMTMFGVTTTAIQNLTTALEADYDCLVFHATGTGGQSMEKLADSGLLAGAIDLTTTEVCDLLMGGVFPATEDRFGAFARTRIPYVGSVGALDMVNFGARATVPETYAHRSFVEHNPQVTLMRTTPEENTKMGRWIGTKLNAMDGPVRFILPEGGVSALDAPGQPFDDTEARAALFDALTETVRQTPNRQLIRHPGHINSPEFADAALRAFAEIMPKIERHRHAAH